jgi:hypothetical protein
LYSGGRGGHAGSNGSSGGGGGGGGAAAVLRSTTVLAVAGGAGGGGGAGGSTEWFFSDNQANRDGLSGYTGAYITGNTGANGADRGTGNDGGGGGGGGGGHTRGGAGGSLRKSGNNNTGGNGGSAGENLTSGLTSASASYVAVTGAAGATISYLEPTVFSANSPTAFYAPAGRPSTAQTVTITNSTGLELTHPITVTVPANFEISPDGATYSGSLSLLASELPKSLLVRVAATAASGSVSGNLTIASDGVSTLTVPLSAAVEILSTNRLASGTTLDIEIQVANQVVTVASTGSAYTFTLSGGATNVWTGFAANTSVSGTTLTVTPGSTYDTINLTDSVAGVAVTFNTSGANSYADQFNVTLNDTPGAVTFNGSSRFSGSNGLNILTTRNIAFAPDSSLSLVDGNLSLDANTQTPATSMLVPGIEIKGATVETTGSGITTLRARGGTGAAASFLNKGIAVLSGGSLVGGTTGTMTIEGKGFAGSAAVAQGQGVFVSGRNLSTLVVSRISSNGADVAVTGYGAENTDATIGLNACNAGVTVGGATSSTGTFYGTITSGGSGAVTVTGYGGTTADPASAVNTFCSGVRVNGTAALITSGGTGKVTVNGTGGGSPLNSQYCFGVDVGSTGATIGGGAGASVEVTGRGPSVDNRTANYLWGVVVWSGGAIKAAAGAGTTLVTGYGGGSGASIGTGVYVSSTGSKISSDGSGSVTVIGYGGNALGTGNSQRGVVLYIDAGISSGGGAVRVEGYGGGGPATSNNFGVNLAVGGYITAGGTGNVTVLGWGGNRNGTTGLNNHGILVDSAGNGQAPGYISSGGGDVVVQGDGGGGSADSPSASSSGTNCGVSAFQGGYITAGGSGAVSVTGQGGNRSPGATGAGNLGVYVADRNGTTSNLYSSIRSNGGAVTVNGTGGGSQTAAGSSNSNHGVQVKLGGTITAGGTGTVSVTGTGGNPSVTGTGGSNCGVNVDGTTTLAKITSNNGNVIVTGTGGSRGSGTANHGIYLNAGGKITTDGIATTVSLTGTGGDSSGSTNHGVFVTGGTSPDVSSVTSGGGSVSILGNGGGRLTSGSNSGVSVASGAIVTSGGSSGTVTVAGQGGAGTGNLNHGVSVATGGASITSGGGDVSITGTEGGASTHVGISVGSGGSVTTASTGGAVSLSGNSLALAGHVSAGSGGIVNLSPRSSGVAMNLGLVTDAAGGPVALTSTELNQITAATINLGSNAAGSLTVSQPIAVPAGANLNLITAAGSSLTPSASGTDVTMGSSKVLDLSTISTLNLAINGTTADSGYQRLVLADPLSLTGKSLNLTGSYTPAAGNEFTIVSASDLSGAFDGLPNGSNVVFNGIPLKIGYTATSVTLTATPVSAPPVFAGYAVTAKTGKTAAISPAKILARASDPDGGAVTLTRVFGPSAQGGTVSLTGTVNYTPAASFTGADSFDIELTGSRGGILRATITVTVTGDAAAGLNQTELKLRDGKVDLTFRGIPGRSYTIQRSTNLLTWTTLATVTAAADGRITVTDPLPPQPSAYYRTQP